MGLPILIAAPDGEATEIVETERAGIVTRSEDAQALAQAVRNLHQDAATRHALGNVSLAAASGYSRENQAREMMEVFNDAVAGRPAADTA